MTQWQTIIRDLKKAGKTQQEIATAVSCSQNYISDLSRGVCGKRLSYEIAQALLSLHQKHHVDANLDQSTEKNHVQVVAS